MGCVGQRGGYSILMFGRSSMTLAIIRPSRPNPAGAEHDAFSPTSAESRGGREESFLAQLPYHTPNRVVHVYCSRTWRTGFPVSSLSR